MAFWPSSKSNSKIDGNQVNFGTVDFQPHQPTLAPVFATLDQEMDLTTRSFKFRVRSLGSIRLSDPTNSGPLAGKIAIAVTSETSMGSSNEVNSPVSTKPTNSKGNAINKLDEIMENWDLKESSGYSDMDFKGNSGNISNYPEEDFTAGYGDVSDKPEDTWRT
jgi:hypothetical protein